MSTAYVLTNFVNQNRDISILSLGWYASHFLARVHSVRKTIHLLVCEHLLKAGIIFRMFNAYPLLFKRRQRVV